MKQFQAAAFFLTKKACCLRYREHKQKSDQLQGNKGKILSPISQFYSCKIGIGIVYSSRPSSGLLERQGKILSGLHKKADHSV